MKTYFVYIVTNKPNGTIYVGVTNDLERRISEHKKKLIKGFTSRYNLDKLVYFEDFSDVEFAISCEKKIKGWVRKKKIELIELKNPSWVDLSLQWFVES
jgi:putative endonuclease